MQVSIVHSADSVNAICLPERALYFHDALVRYDHHTEYCVYFSS